MATSYFESLSTSFRRAHLLLTCGALLVSTAAAGCHRKEETIPPPPNPAVLTTVVHARPEPALSRRGAVTAGARLRLGFNAPGVIATLTVKTGDAVRKGQLLARLKDGDAAASLQAAQANRARALRDYSAADTLAASGAVSTYQRDVARSTLQVADANASFAAESFGQRRLVSPIAGTVLQRLAEPGEAVAPGLPVLVIEDTQRLVVKVGVNERELARVRPNQGASLVVDGSESAVPAIVTSIAPAPAEDGLYSVEVSPASAAKVTFRPGTLLTVRFDEEKREPSMRIPLDAIVHRDDKAWVFAVAGTAQEPSAKIREVIIDRADGTDVLVRSQLKDGDRIIREGAYFLRDGQNIRLLD
jgi:RND family efflux transporter MFP subunit